MSTLKDIPQLARDGSNLTAVMEAVREALQTFRGYRGNPLDKALTLREAISIGVLNKDATYTGGSGGVGPPGPIGPTGPSGGSYTPDLTAPPTPSGLAVTAGVSSLFIECDAQVYTEGHGHDRTVVYGAKWPSGSPPTFSSAVVLFEFQGTFGAYPTDPATTWCIWIKWKSIDGVESTSPAGGTNGEQATTSVDVSTLLTALTGQITESELYSTLGTRIDLIDAASGVAGSVNARVATKGATFVQNTTPTATKAGDLWIDTSENMLLYSEQLNNAVWNKLNVSVTADFVADPLGAMTADRLTGTSSFGAVTQGHAGTIFVAALTPFTWSIWLRAAAPVTITLSQTENDPGGSSTAYNPVSCNVTTSWQRFSVSGVTAATTNRMSVSVELTTGQVVYASKAQVERSPSAGVYKLTTSATALPSKTMYAWTGSAWTAADDIRIGANSTAIATETAARVSADTAIISTATSLAATVATNTAAITTEATARATADTALATSISTVSASTATNTAAVTAEATARAAETGALFAQYTVKVDVNGYVSGFGLASTAVNGTPLSDFIVRADKFSISSPSGPGISPATPFVVQTTPGTINGVAVPVGVYMDAAYIQNGTITTAKIGDAQIDNAKVANLDAAKLTVGTGVVGGNLRSSNYVAGTSGWLVTPAGFFEAQNALLRGTVYASAGEIGGITIAAAAVRAGQTAYDTGTGFWLGASGSFSIGNSAGNKLTWNGTTLSIVGGGTFSGALSAASGTFAGNLSAAGGTFAGALSAATGTFSGALSAASGSFAGSLSAASGTFAGTLTAGAVNAVNTINIAGQAVTIPSSSYTAGAITLNSGDQVIGTLSFTSTGTPVYTNFCCYLTSVVQTEVVTLKLKRAGATLVTQIIAVDGYAPAPLAYSETPGAGSVTYDVTASTPSSASVTATGRALFSLETKR